MNMNSTIYKRLRDLKKNEYIEKTDSLYKPGFKALFLFSMIDLRVISNLPDSRMDALISEVDLENDAERFMQGLSSRIDADKDSRKLIRKLLQDPETRIASSSVLKQLVLSW